MVNKIENLKSQLKCAQSELFYVLRTYIRNFSQDKKLHEIIEEPYCTKDRGGYITEYDKCKRDGIVKHAIYQLNTHCSLDTHQKILDMYNVASNYVDINAWVCNATLPSVLEHHLKKVNTLQMDMHAKIDKFRVNPARLN